jgi:hypothetical protein
LFFAAWSASPSLPTPADAGVWNRRRRRFPRQNPTHGCALQQQQGKSEPRGTDRTFMRVRAKPCLETLHLPDPLVLPWPRIPILLMRACLSLCQWSVRLSGFPSARQLSVCLSPDVDAAPAIRPSVCHLVWVQRQPQPRKLLRGERPQVAAGRTQRGHVYPSALRLVASPAPVVRAWHGRRDTRQRGASQGASIARAWSGRHDAVGWGITWASACRACGRNDGQVRRARCQGLTRRSGC